MIAAVYSALVFSLAFFLVVGEGEVGFFYFFQEALGIPDWWPICPRFVAEGGA